MKKFLFIILLLALPAFAQSVTNNTSACGPANGFPTAGCNLTTGMPFLGNPANTGLETATPDPLPVNTSTLSVHNYLYAGSTTRHIGEYQPWFCNTSNPCNGHKVNGMEESNAAQVLVQAQWMFTVGMDATVVDWYGCSDYCSTPQSSAQHYNNSVTLALASAINSNPSTTPKFMIMLDIGAIDGSGTGQCAPAGGDQSACVIAAINLQMDYVAATWLGHSYYETDRNGRPMVLIFGINTGPYPGTNFTTVWNAVSAHVTSGNSCGTGCTYPATIDFIDENAGAFSESGIAGGYAWPQPNSWSSTNQFCYLGNPCSFNYIADFYSHARSNPSKIAIGVGYKGFDDFNASWGSNRVIAQECGQLPGLLGTAVSTAGYSSSSQLDYFQWATLNDYEEGTEVESGIDNCMTVSTPVISGSTMSWSLLNTDATYASTNTINSFSIYTGTGSPTTLFASGISATSTSHAAPTLTAGQSAWVYMVGQPLIHNQLSGPSVNNNPAGYVAYTGTDIVIPSTTPPNLGTYTKNNAIVYDNSYVSHGFSSANLSPHARCTDQNFTPTNGLKGFSAGQGGGGGAIMWNAGSPPTLIHVVTNGGGSAISLFNATTMSCLGAITADKNLSHPGSSSNIASFGDGQFDRQNSSKWWAFGVVGNDILSNTFVTPLTINTTTGTFTEGATAVDFKSGLPLGTNAPEWLPNHAYIKGAYVSHTMVPGEFFTYQSNYSGFHLGDIIWPLYPSGCGFTLRVAGTTGATPPNWSTSANCGVNPTVVKDGTATWHSLVGPAKFVFQLISSSGTSGSPTPAFVPVATKHPDVLSQVSDNGLTWENVGVNSSNPIWGSLTSVSFDGTKFAKGWSTNIYGADPSSLGGAFNLCVYSGCGGGQGTGFYIVTYDSVANVYHLLNTVTAMQTDITCSGGIGYNCAGGTQVFTTAGTATGIACPFFIHDNSGYANSNPIQMQPQAGYIGVGCPSGINNLLWSPYQPFNATTQVQVFRTPLNHPASGVSHVSFTGQNASNYGFETGAYAVEYPINDIADVPPITWQAVPCDTIVPSVWFPGDPNQPCFLQWDNHLSWAYNPNQDDTTPVCGTYFGNVVANAGQVPVAAYEGEVVCYSTVPSWTDTSTPNSGQTQWRFGHTFNFQANVNFNIWFNIGQWSLDGLYFAYGTDWYGQFGSTTGVAPVLPIPNASVLCLGGFPWQASHTYTLGSVINPVANLSGGGSPYDVFQAIAVTGPSGSTAPAWGTASIGSNLTDNGIIWQNVGVGNCRGDVVIVKMTPFSTPPPSGTLTNISPIIITF
jgi:hypothetical protein